MRFTGKRAVVTGGAGGIGRATALRLADEGAFVLIGDVDTAAGEALAASSKGTVAFRRCDVTSDDDIAALMTAAHDGGGLDIVFNNAGAGGAPEPIGEIDAAGWDRTQALLTRSVALGIRHAAPLLKARGGGAIVNTASVAAIGVGYGPVAYSTAKAAVLHLTHVAAAQLAGDGIRVNAVLPGFIVTDIFARHLDIAPERLPAAQAAIAAAAAQTQPIARAGRPEDIAAAVAFLASDEAGFVTGTSILVDGGMTLGQRSAWDPTIPSLATVLEQFR